MAWRESIDLLRFRENVSLETLRVLEAILRYLATKANDKKMTFDTESILGIKAMDRHLQKGGNLLTTLIKPEDEDMFKQLLEYHHVPYVCSQMSKESGELQSVFITRDSDADFVQQAVNELYMELGQGLTQLPVKEFLARNNGLNISTLGNLSEAEMQEFELELGKSSVAYAVNKVSTDNYEILYIPRDENIIKEAAMTVAYTFSGSEGQEYLENVQKEINKERDFDTAIANTLQKKEIDWTLPEQKRQRDEWNNAHTKENDVKAATEPVVFVVDSRNPNVFIAVTRSGFSTHNLHKTEDVNKETGEISESIEDTNIFHGSGERGTLMHYVGQLHEPVIVDDITKLGLLKGFNNHSVALLPADVTTANMEKLTGELIVRNDKYKKTKVRAKLSPDNKIFTAVNLPDRVMEKINQMIKDIPLLHTVPQDNKIAYNATDRKHIEKMLNEELYQDTQSPLEYYERKLYYAGAGEICFSDRNTATKYLVDADNPEYVVRLDEEGLTIFMNNKERTKISRNDPIYNSVALDLLNKDTGMSCPVVLTKEEFDSSNKLDIISERTPQMQARDAQAFVYNNTNKEKRQLLETINGSHLANPSQRQQEAMQINRKWEHGFAFVDDRYIDKMVASRADDRLQNDRMLIGDNDNAPKRTISKPAPDVGLGR